MMRVLVAPDDFKGTMSAPEVAGALARGLRSAEMDVEELPIADGGDGTLDVLVGALGGEVRTETVADPLGRAVRARWALLPDRRTAVVELAEASGLWRVAPEERDPWRASTRGTGELIVAAARAGATDVLLGVGGSATTDGGAAALEALAAAGVGVAIRVICDVRVPFEDAARVFGKQKGADDETVAALSARLDDLAVAAPRDPRGRPMTGAAGGLAGGLWAHCGAELVPGAAFVLDAIGFDGRAAEADFVVTGEGRLDLQTFTGKAVAEVAGRCRRLRVPVHAVVGSNALAADQIPALGIASVRTASTADELERVAWDLAHATRETGAGRRGANA